MQSIFPLLSFHPKRNLRFFQVGKLVFLANRGINVMNNYMGGGKHSVLVSTSTYIYIHLIRLFK